MQYNNLLNKLYKYNRLQKNKIDLSQIITLNNILGNPVLSLKNKLIHVTGTNGKGTLCEKLNNYFINNNLNTGVYTSPHLFTFRERIRLNNNKITEEDIIYYFSDFVNDLVNINNNNFSFFELTTAISFKYFMDNKVDVGIIEVGIGGDLDATNIIEDPLCSVITSVSLDHTNFLGSTTLEIAS